MDFIVFQQIQYQMILETQIKKPRLFSAKIGGRTNDHPVRPMTGISGQISTRQELIQNIYTGHSINQRLNTGSAKALTTRQFSAVPKKERSANKVIKIPKKKQEMAEEIMNLKQTVNKLVEELSLQRGKTENMRKKNAKYTKTFQIQIQNQKFLGKPSQSHLVTGLKAMYDALKEKYQQINAKFEQLSKKQNISRESELTTYIKILETENKNLSSKLQRLSSLTQTFQTGTIRQASDYVIGELETQNKAMNQKFRELSAKYKMRNQNLKDRNTKIAFLQKLIIEKDNNIHYTSRLIKKVQEQNMSLRTCTSNDKQQMINLQMRYSSELQQMKHTQTQLIAEHSRSLLQMQSQKDARISSLEKENAYLHLMIKQLREANIIISRQNQQLKELTNRELSHPFQYDSKNSLQSLPNRQIHFISEQQKSLTSYATKKSSIFNEETDRAQNNRSIKKRRVQLTQILEIAEFVRLRLINNRISASELRQLFNYDASASNIDQSIQHKQKYIKMRELRPLLQNKPFNLRADDALMLARYLIEDDQSQQVTFDEQSQNLREAVKSIIKNLVKDYPVATPQSPVTLQLSKTIEQYGASFKKTLKSSEPSGYITKKKFLDTLRVLGIDCSDEVKDLMLAIMSQGAYSLNELKYALLF